MFTNLIGYLLATSTAAVAVGLSSTSELYLNGVKQPTTLVFRLKTALTSALVIPVLVPVIVGLVYLNLLETILSFPDQSEKKSMILFSKYQLDFEFKKLEKEE